MDAEFDSYSEYVYSIRRKTNYDYNEKLTFVVPVDGTVQLHVALKVPNLLKERTIKGSLAVTVNGEDTYISIPINCLVEIPKIICPRSLFVKSLNTNVIRLAIKKGKKGECKVPFKNLYGFNL